MDYFIPLTLGVVLKFFDDSIDLKLNIPNIYIYTSQILIIILSILAIKNDVILGFIVLILLIISNYCKKFDHIFWYIYLFTIFFTCLYFKNQIITVLVDYDNYIKLVCIVIISLLVYFEETGCTEEYSKYKTTIRTYNIIWNSLLIFFLEYYKYTETFGLEFIVKLLIFINSYFITNIIIQYIFIHKKLKTNNNNNNNNNKQIENTKKETNDNLN